MGAGGPGEHYNKKTKSTRTKCRNIRRRCVEVREKGRSREMKSSADHGVMGQQRVATCLAGWLLLAVRLTNRHLHHSATKRASNREDDRIPGRYSPNARFHFRHPLLVIAAAAHEVCAFLGVYAFQKNRPLKKKWGIQFQQKSIAYESHQIEFSNLKKYKIREDLIRGISCDF